MSLAREFNGVGRIQQVPLGSLLVRSSAKVSQKWSDEFGGKRGRRPSKYSYKHSEAFVPHP